MIEVTCQPICPKIFRMLNFINKKIRTTVIVAVAAKINNKNVKQKLTSNWHTLLFYKNKQNSDETQCSSFSRIFSLKKFLWNNFYLLTLKITRQVGNLYLSIIINIGDKEYSNSTKEYKVAYPDETSDYMKKYYFVGA